jgi:hypothetical protein
LRNAVSTTISIGPKWLVALVVTSLLLSCSASGVFSVWLLLNSNYLGGAGALLLFAVLAILTTLVIGAVVLTRQNKPRRSAADT